MKLNFTLKEEVVPKDPKKPWRMVRVLREGYIWNPLKSYPRNKECFCGSSIKFKKCCLPGLSPAIKKETAELIKKDWNLFKEVFNELGVKNDD